MAIVWHPMHPLPCSCVSHVCRESYLLLALPSILLLSWLATAIGIGSGQARLKQGAECPQLALIVICNGAATLIVLTHCGTTGWVRNRASTKMPSWWLVSTCSTFS